MLASLFNEETKYDWSGASEELASTYLSFSLLCSPVSFQLTFRELDSTIKLEGSEHSL